MCILAEKMVCDGIYGFADRAPGGDRAVLSIAVHPDDRLEIKQCAGNRFDAPNPSAARQVFESIQRIDYFCLFADFLQPLMDGMRRPICPGGERRGHHLKTFAAREAECIPVAD